MLFSSVARWLKPSRQTARPRPPRPRRRVLPQLEALEDRFVPSTDLVTNLSGSSADMGSLPFEVANANPGDTIQFAANLKGGTIKLDQGTTLYINKKPCHQAPAYCQLTIHRALPRGSVLEVAFENDDHMTVGTGRFIGGVGWQEP